MKNNYQSHTYIVAAIVIGLFLLFSIKPVTATPFPNSYFQEVEISGTIIDKEGLPVPGATVSIKDSKTGTLTDIEGNYELTAPASATLIISYLGFKSREVAVDGQEEIDIQLEEDVQALGAVEINTGYYSTTDRERTGNISRVSGKDIEMQPVVSPLQALQGRMAGVEITPNGNLPGNASTIRIRGTNSLREEGNFPLYIIDGVPINSTPLESNSNLTFGGIDPLNTLNLSNIESIEVLKDADATSIYGSRGANGVILITTKKGRKGKTELQARVYSGASSVPNRVDLLNTEVYLQIRRRAFENDQVEPTEANAFDLLVWDEDRYTDWQDKFFGGTSQVTDVNLNASGGNENTTFRLSGSYHSQGTVFIGDYDYSKVTAGAQISHTSDNNRLNLDLSINYGVDTNNLVGYLNLSAEAFLLPPNAPSLFNEDNTLNWQDWGEVGWDNPLEGYYNHSTTKSNNLVSNLVVSYQLAKGLSFKSNFGYTNLINDELVKRPLRSYNPANTGNIENRSGHVQSDRNSYIIEPQLVYNAAIGGGKLDALIGSTFQQSLVHQQSLFAEGYVTESLIGNLNAAENIGSSSSSNTKYRYSAIFARLGYNWKGKYLINLTGRRDGSSRFGPNNRFANFGAGGAAWIFSEEPFIKNALEFLSFGKLRGSYGTTGNDQIGDYGYLDAYEATRGPGGLYPTQLSNPDYSWEVNKKIEAAIELGFIEDKINLGLSWYRNRSSNQLVGYPLPAIAGFTSVQANLPATVENTGLEVELSTFNIDSQNFRWQTSLNTSFPRNELINYPNLNQSSYANTYRVGEPLNIGLLYQYEGIDTETGFYKIADMNNDETFDYQDRNLVWDRGREFFGGISNNIMYRNFSLQFLFDFVKQEGTLTLFDAGELGIQRREILNALDENSSFQTISQSTPAGTAYSQVLNSNLPIVDASFMRLRTLSLNYNLPGRILEKIGIREGKLFVNGQNLFTLTNYEGLDPESPYGGTEFRQLRSITGGVQFNL